MSEDRGAWRLVARRDFLVRARERGFVISTGITLLVLTILVLLRAAGSAATASYDLGLVGDNGKVADYLQQLAPTGNIIVRVVQFSDENSALSALRSGRVDAVLVDEQELRSLGGAPPNLAEIVSLASSVDEIRRLVGEAGISGDQVTAALQPVRSVALEVDENRSTKTNLATIAAILLYGQIVGYGVWVASGVIEEKSSRVVELLLSTIRPRQLLAGKILGIGSLGFLQLVLIGTYAAILATVLGVVHVPAYTIGTLGVVLGWFALGFTFYACVFAVAGSLVSRQEDLQNAVVPINLTMLGSLAFAIVAAQKPDVWVVKLGSLLPVSSPLVMPARIALGVAPWWEIALSLAILLGSIALLIPLAGRLYSSAVLRTGARQKIREAWRAART